MRARTCAKHTEPWKQWRNHYCGTCKTIGARYGQAARMALNHDTVFLSELLTSLRPQAHLEQSSAYRSFNCMTLPKRDDEMPAILRYAAAATLVLTEFKVIDHIEDTGKRRWRSLARVFSKAFRAAERDLKELRFPVAALRDALHTQSAREQSGSTIADFSAPTAEATRLFFAHGANVAELGPEAGETLARIGRAFGELAYLLDAFEDYDKDRTSGAFNAVRAAYRIEDRTQPLADDTKQEIVAQLQALVAAIRADLELLPLTPEVAASFGSRLKSNVDSKLGLRICCAPKAGRTKISRKQRWDNAIQFARRISNDAPKWRAPLTVGAVALVAYLAPAHSRAATSPSECLSLSFNLMALGSVFALAVSGPIPPVDPSINPGTIAKAAAAARGKASAGRSGRGAGGGGGNCGCCNTCTCCDDCCCDSDCCTCCACEWLSCEGCSCCGDCCGSCGNCGDCCSGCGDCGDCCSGCDC
ncbi:MAG TPA: DUF5685 family protein [Bryobacteraceae bacterium]